MSSIARKGLSATLLVCMLAAPVAAAATPAERPEGRREAAAAGWVGSVVGWFGDWLIGRFGEDAPRQGGAGEDGKSGVYSASGENDGGAGGDPNG